MTNLDKLIKHYGRIAKENGGTAAHYAAGVRDTLILIQRMRDEFRGEQKSLWDRRQGSGSLAMTTHRLVRMFADRLDGLDDPQVVGSIDDPIGK